MKSSEWLRLGMQAAGRKDQKTARTLIRKALKADPRNDTAWVWLARLEDDPERKRDYLKRALALNPQNATARAALKALPEADPGPAHGATVKPASRSQKAQIARHLKQAAKYQREGQHEDAVAEWVYALAIQVDHPAALQLAADTLEKLGYANDSEELVWRAIDAGTQHPFAYQRALQLASDRDDYAVVEDLRERLLALPGTDDETLVQIIDAYVTEQEIDEAFAALHRLIEQRPKSKPLHIKLGDLYAADGDTPAALSSYNRAASLGRSKEAEERLAAYPPILTDRERGSLLLAIREVIPVGLFAFFLAWQDARLDILNMTPRHWVGTALSLLGAYLLVTATSSPRHLPTAQLIGAKLAPANEKAAVTRQGRGRALEEASKLPLIPPTMRILLGMAGCVLLVLAFALVFGDSMQLLFDFLAE